MADSLDSCACGVERKGSRLELTPPSVGGSVRRPHAPPRWGRFFDTRGEELGRLRNAVGYFLQHIRELVRV
jgi:hypothetical protein